MLTPIPDKVPDPKDAVLWAVFSKLQCIDENPAARAAFCIPAAINYQVGNSQPLFEFELEQLRAILKIPASAPEVEVNTAPRSLEGVSADVAMRDDL